MFNKMKSKTISRFSNQPENTSENGDSVVQNVVFATEAGHWYKQDGTPFYTVENKSKPGTMRSATLRDARKVGAVPSVTGITGLIKGEGLIQYIKKQVFQATLACPYAFKDETPEAHMARAFAMADDHKNRAAKRGTDLHAAIHRFLRGQDVGDRWRAHIEKAIGALRQLGIELGSGEYERSFAHPLGYGGACDYHERTDPLVIDWKSKETIELAKKYGFDEHVMQIASYGVGLGLGLRALRGISVFVGEQDVQVLILEWPEPELQLAWEQFKHLLAVWQIRKKYCPAFGPEEREENV